MALVVISLLSGRFIGNDFCLSNELVVLGAENTSSLPCPLYPIHGQAQGSDVISLQYSTGC